MKRSNPIFRKLESGLIPTLRFLLVRNKKSSELTHVPQKILFIKSCCMGDAILSLYAIREFKTKNPTSQIEAYVSARIAEVYQRAPWIEAVHVLPLTGFRLGREILHPKFGIALLKTFWILRKKRFDLLIDLEAYRQYGVLLPRILSIPHSRGFEVEGSKPSGHAESVKRAKEEPEWECFFKIFGVPIPAQKPSPLFPKSLASKQSLPIKTIGIVFGASLNWPEKKWPVEYFSQVIEALHEHGFRVRLYGAGYEKEESAILLAQHPRLISTVGDLSLTQLLDSLSECDLVVGNDTGTLHAAAAVGTPSITLFGPTSPNKWNALTSKPLFLSTLPCRPCYYLGSMPFCSHRNCMNQLKPSLVIQEILTDLRERVAFQSAPSG